MNAFDLINDFGNAHNIPNIQFILQHLQRHYPFKMNMHLRDTRQLNGKRKLRFLHVVKLKNSSHILGHISGPHQLEIEYEIELVGTQVRFSVLNYSGKEKDLRRIAKNLIKWLYKRALIESHANGNEPRTNYKKGEFYLKRSQSGAALSNPKVQNGIANNQFSEAFAKKFQKWGFIVLNP